MGSEISCCRKCKNCLHWSDLYDHGCDENGDYEVRECEYRYQVNARDLPFLAYDAVLKTGPEFGCVHWEEKK